MPATSTTDSLDVVRGFNQTVFNEREYDRITEFQAPEYRQHGPMAGQEVEGNDGSLETMQGFHEAFPDLEATEEFAFSDGAYVCTRYSYHGTHEGDLMGIPPTGNEATVAGTVINRIDDGKIVEGWVQVDFLSLLQQLELVPDLEDLQV